MGDLRGNRRPYVEETGLALGPCPFCAATNVGFYEHSFSKEVSVMCNLCGAEGPKRSDPKEAGRLWNRRVG